MRIEKSYEITDFDSVEIGSAVRAQVSRADGFSIVVSGEEELMSDLAVEKAGTTLRIYVRFRFNLNRLLNWQPPDARVTLPDLKTLRLSGASNAEVTGFEADHEVRLETSGASNLKGSLSAPTVTADASGASHVEIRGAGKAVTVDASGGSHVDLSEFSADEARIDASGASHAKVVAREKLDYSVSGASHLEFQGSPRIGRANSSGASSVTSR